MTGEQITTLTKLALEGVQAVKGVRADIRLVAQRIDEVRQSLDAIDDTVTAVGGEVEMAREILGSFDFSGLAKK